MDNLFILDEMSAWLDANTPQNVQNTPAVSKPVEVDFDDFFKSSTPTSTIPAPEILTATPATPSPKVKKNNTLAIKAFAIVIAIILLVGSLCLTAYMNKQVDRSLERAASIISSASLEADEIVEKANSDAKKTIATAEAEAKQILEENS